MANFYCNDRDCHYGFTDSDITLEDKLAGFINCPVCGTTNEIIDSSQFQPAEQAILDLTEQVTALQAQVTKLTKVINMLAECAHSHRDGVR